MRSWRSAPRSSAASDAAERRRAARRVLRRLHAIAAAVLVLALAGATETRAAKPSSKAESKSPAKSTKTATAPVPRWLVLGPAVDPLPVFHDEGPFAYDLADLLDEDRFPARDSLPEAGHSLTWPGGETLTWRVEEAKDGQVTLAREAKARGPSAARLATWITASRFTACELQLLGSHPRRAWLDGVALVSGGTDSARADLTAKLALTRGKHLLVVDTVLDPAREASWTAGGALRAPDTGVLSRVSLSLDPARDLELRDVLDGPRITAIETSPDGKRVVASLERYVPGTDRRETWVEVRSTDSGQLEATWRGGFSGSQPAWRPDGRAITYMTTDDSDPSDAKKSKSFGTIWVAELDTGVVAPLLEHVENLEGYRWSPDGKSLVFSTSVKPEDDSRGVKRLESIADRQADYRKKTHLSLLALPGRTVRRLTAGAATTTAGEFSNDGKSLLFMRTLEDLSARPYERTELWQLDLTTFDAKKLRDSRWMNTASFSPDGSRILVRGGVSDFGPVGNTLPDSIVPNDFDQELFVWDPASNAVEALTRDFDPSVDDAWWSRADGQIYLKAEDGDAERLYRLDPVRKAFTRLDVGEDVVERVSFSRDASVAVVTACSPWSPSSLVAVDLRTGAHRVLARPMPLTQVRRARVEPWGFTAKSGANIDGRFYLPPDFDPGKKYPCIVYYYGGTAPVERDFGGRYPKEWWAAQGYVVYVLQPSGTTGYGQKFSAVHVNDWGEQTSREVIEGTERFVESHPYVDPKRIGCIGASYGGFLTMRLVTVTNRFAAAVAHAGISSLDTYWGAGYWGYSYSGVASAQAFPWNRRDVYVDKSPLYHADSVRTPILLTHGTVDTNVPTVESDQFYTALKLLGAPVEYLQVEGLDHLITDHAKRIVWSSSIVAWFDRWLKGEPEWWNDLYPDRAASKGK